MEMVRLLFFVFGSFVSCCPPASVQAFETVTVSFERKRLRGIRVHVEKLYLEFENAYRDFSEKDRAANKAISTVSRRIAQAKSETDAGIQECKTIIADSGRTAAAQSAAAIRLEVLLSRTFPVTPEEEKTINEAVTAADAAFSTVSRVRTDFDEAHGAALRKLKEMRDAVFGNVPSAMNLMHTNQVLHDRLRAVQEGK